MPQEFSLRRAALDISNGHITRLSAQPTFLPCLQIPQSELISPHGANAAPTGQENARILAEKQNERTTSDERKELKNYGRTMVNA
jgi:hypothetical protein